MITDCPSSSVSLAVYTRPSVSTGPPGASGLTTVMGLTGKVCAAACAAASSRAQAHADVIDGFMALLLVTYFGRPLRTVSWDIGALWHRSGAGAAAALSCEGS